MAGFEIKSRSSNSEQVGCGGRVIGTVFFFFFFSIGAAFVFFMTREAAKGMATYAWKKTDCMIVSSSLEDTRSDEDPYELKISYAYEFSGRQYTSDQYKRTSRMRGDNYGKIYRLTRTYAPETETTCFVDPKNPSNAVLRRELPWFLLALPLPLIFVAVGLGGIYFMWKSGSGKKEKKTSISSKASGKAGKRVAMIFFGAFLLIGGGILFGIFVPAVLKVLLSKGWAQTPCTVIKSQVLSKRGDDSTTYKVDIVYRYEIDGVEYRSNRYTFLGGSSSGRSGKAAVVRAHPPGKETVCLVNPKDPWDAVLKRGFTLGYLFGLIPLVFFLIGFIGSASVAAGRSVRGMTVPDHPDWMPAIPVSDKKAAVSSFETIDQAGPVQLKSKSSPLFKLLGVIFFALFWNGIVSVFLFQIYQGFARGRPEWFLTVFMIPFVLVGLGAILGIFYCLLALFNPRVTLAVSAPAVPLGGSVDLAWELTGRSNRVDRLTIKLEGVEESTYRRGTRTYTDKETFATIDILDTSERHELISGEASLKVPADTMHSFKASNNKIIWTLKVHANIPKWPDVKEEFPFVVLPMPHSQRSQS